MVFCSGSQGLGRRCPSPGSSVDPVHRAFCCTLTSTSSDLCVCTHTEAHVPTYRRPDALSHTHSAHLSSHTHSVTQSPAPTPRLSGHWDPIGGTLSSSWGGPLPTPETARKERLTGGGQVCTDMGDCTSESQWESGDKTGTSRGGRAGRGAAPAAKPLPVRGPGVSASLPFLPSFQEALRTSLRIRRKKRGRRRWRRTEPQE